MEECINNPTKLNDEYEDIWSGQFDLAGMEKFLFEKRENDYKSYLEDVLSTNNLRIMEKNEICDVIEKIRPKSLWERNFESIGTQEKWEKQIKDIHDGRNKVAHSKNMRYEEYVSINKMMNAINRDCDLGRCT